MSLYLQASDARHRMHNKPALLRATSNSDSQFCWQSWPICIVYSGMTWHSRGNVACILCTSELSWDEIWKVISQRRNNGLWCNFARGNLWVSTSSRQKIIVICWKLCLFNQNERAGRKKEVGTWPLESPVGRRYLAKRHGQPMINRNIKGKTTKKATFWFYTF